jgi:hypothetical protein
MSGLCRADVLGRFAPVEELAPFMGYKQTRMAVRRLRELGVAIAYIDRRPHADVDEIAPALKREAERAASPRPRGRPRKNAAQ